MLSVERAAETLQRVLSRRGGGGTGTEKEIAFVEGRAFALCGEWGVAFSQKEKDADELFRRFDVDKSKRVRVYNVGFEGLPSRLAKRNCFSLAELQYDAVAVSGHNPKIVSAGECPFAFADLPELQTTDVQCRLLDARVGDVVQIERLAVDNVTRTKHWYAVKK